MLRNPYENNIHFISEAEYHADPRISRSQVWKMLTRSAAHARVPTPATTAMEIGTATHAALLEPFEFDKRFEKGPSSRRGNAWKEKYEEALAQGKTLLTEADYLTVQKMTEAVLKSTTASSLLQSNTAVKEATSFFTDSTGLECKARFDILDETDDLIIDLKTTSNASADAFSKSCGLYGYHLQAAWYMAAYPAKQFLFIVVEKEEPYGISFFELDESSLSEGERLMREGLDYWKVCAELDVWPSYPDSLRTISIPHWSRR